jgi:hypothetical protein
VGFLNIRIKDTVSAATPNPANEKEKLKKIKKEKL